jgi:hypothetical protein
MPVAYLISPNATVVLGAGDVDYCNRLHFEQPNTAHNGKRRRKYASEIFFGNAFKRISP